MATKKNILITLTSGRPSSPAGSAGAPASAVAASVSAFRRIIRQISVVRSSVVCGSRPGKVSGFSAAGDAAEAADGPGLVAVDAGDGSGFWANLSEASLPG